MSESDILGGESRIDETRVGVCHVAVRIVDAGRSPTSVADQLDVPLGAVYEALAYYYDNPEEMRTHRAAQEEAREELRSRAVNPPVGPDSSR